MANEDLVFAKALDEQNIRYSKDGDSFSIEFNSLIFRPNGGNLVIDATTGESLVILSVTIFTDVSSEYRSKIIDACNALNNRHGEVVCFLLDDDNNITCGRCMQWSADYDTSLAVSNVVWYVGYIMYLLGAEDGPAKDIFNMLM